MRPTQKTAYSSCFWRFGISRLLITPIGRRAVTKSLAMLMAEFAYLALLDSKWPFLSQLDHLPSLHTREAARVVEKVRGCPEHGNRDTHDHGAKHSPKSPGNRDTEHDIACFAESDLREDAQVLHQNGQLGESEGSVVTPQRRPEVDAHLLHVDRWIPDVQTHTRLGLSVGRNTVHE